MPNYKGKKRIAYIGSPHLPQLIFMFSLCLVYIVDGIVFGTTVVFVHQMLAYKSDKYLYYYVCLNVSLQRVSCAMIESPHLSCNRANLVSCTKFSFIGYTSGSTFTAFDIKDTKWNYSIYLLVQWAEQEINYTNFQKHFPKA